ncbi:DUF5518 domain-containing protein [Natrinema saccharevitans]|uniref:DUF5518 domain-containing protein n=1 Tax=Natrinema saccharevitans TaxID=301967 RepID=UPI00111598F5|nr:DUF5518 domain-containing protein [Natrinema saccharevitans]
MPEYSIQNKIAAVTDNPFLIAVLLGLVSIPFTLLVSRETTALVNSAPMIATGLLVGYLFNARPADSHRAGLIAGFVASLGGVTVFAMEVAARISPDGSTRLEVVTILLVLVLLVICLAILVMGCAIVGNWVAEMTTRSQSVQ